MNPGPTVVLARATARLREAGVGSPQAEARTLLLHASALSATGLLVARELPADVVARYEQLIDARCAGTPVQHLTGLVGFRAVVVAVGPGVFVPGRKQNWSPGPPSRPPAPSSAHWWWNSAPDRGRSAPR